MPTNTKQVVVVVNDAALQLDYIKDVLTGEGFAVKTFGRAEDALHEMSAGGLVPALVITDLHMSGIDGWQFCRLLKSSEYSMCNNVPVLAVSSTFTEFDSTKLAIVEGADAFLKAPVCTRCSSRMGFLAY